MAGLGAAAIGGIATAPAGGEGALPGLGLAGFGARLYVGSSLVALAGNGLKGLAGDSAARQEAATDILGNLLGVTMGISPIGETLVDTGTDALKDPIKPRSPC